MSPSAEDRVTLHRFADDGRIPNNAHLPLIVYSGVLDRDGDMASACERRFAANGWGDGWRNGIYPYHHFHSTAHEALGIVRGSARVQFGGEKGAILEVSTGDVVVIPAGVGHKRLSASDDLLVIGAYPRGQHVDLCKGEGEDGAHVRQSIREVPLPAEDPVFGADGPLIRHWPPAAPGIP
jgi:uncharacterized protein YjlB